jgi:RNA methyltransferase, TrmH family
MILSSRHNGRVKAVRALRDRKARDRAGLCVCEGVQLVTAAARAGADVECVIVAPPRLTSAIGWNAVRALRRRGADVLEVTGDVFDALACHRYAAQGLAAVVRQRWTRLEDLAAPGAPRRGDACVVRPGPSDDDEGDAGVAPASAHAAWWVALDGVQYPGNLGAVLRTCDATGCAGMILIGPTTDPYDPHAISASRGAVFTRRLARADYAGFLAWKRRHGVRVVGTSPAATTNYRALAYAPPLVLLMGCESRGLGTHAAACDAKDLVSTSEGCPAKRPCADLPARSFAALEDDGEGYGVTEAPRRRRTDHRVNPHPCLLPAYRNVAHRQGRRLRRARDVRRATEGDAGVAPTCGCDAPCAMCEVPGEGAREQPHILAVRQLLSCRMNRVRPPPRLT